MSAFKVAEMSLCLALGALWLGPAAVAAEPRLTDVRVALADGRVSVSCELRDALTDSMMERIATGLPTGFSFQFRLDRDRKRWFDASLGKSTLEIVAMYNAVTSEYLVNFKLDGKLIESRVVRDRDGLERAMTRIESVPVFELAQIESRDRMLVRVRADLGSKPGFLFLPTRISTGWHRSRKFRPNDEAG